MLIFALDKALSAYLWINQLLSISLSCYSTGMKRPSVAEVRRAEETLAMIYASLGLKREPQIIGYTSDEPIKEYVPQYSQSDDVAPLLEYETQ